MRWRGVEVGELDDEALLTALRQAIRILGALWAEVARRRLVRAV